MSVWSNAALGGQYRALRRPLDDRLTPRVRE
jgi:hypothetical protein